MSHDRDNANLGAPDDLPRVGYGEHRTHRHLSRQEEIQELEAELVEIRELVGDITSAQIQVALATAISGIVIASLFAIGILAVWVYHSFMHTEMPAIPLIITSIASAPFAAGVITSLKIPKKARVKLEQK